VSKLKSFSVMSLAVLAGMLLPGLAFASDVPAVEWPKGWAPLSTVTYRRTSGEPLVVVATERDDPKTAEHFSFDAQMRYALFHAMTGARESHVIQPSVVNPRSVQKRLHSFAPIDRAVLRAIFGHDDWSGKNYESRIQLLTERVMQQLQTSQTNGTQS